jgi:hypothetical protein
MVIAITVLIIFFSLILVGIGAYVVLEKKAEDENSEPPIDRSGIYSVIRKSPREDLAQIKPANEALEQFIRSASPLKTDHQIQEILDLWHESIESSIQKVEEGDRDGVQTYRFKIGPLDQKFCTFITEDTYITREQIYNHPELLPPFYPGCRVELVSKEAWDDQDKSGWKPLLPVNGNYEIPDWRQIAS